MLVVTQEMHIYSETKANKSRNQVMCSIGDTDIYLMLYANTLVGNDRFKTLPR